MKCPICKSELVEGSMMRLESTAEHMMCQEPSPKRSYVCPESCCPFGGGVVCWNKYGELYVISMDAMEYGKVLATYILDGNPAPFGSFQRRAWVEIYKADEDIHINLPFGWALQVDWEYEADMDGNVLHRKPKLVWWHNDTMYISGLRMFFHSVRFGQYWKPRKGDEWWRHAAYIFNKNIK